jgi:protoporphyrinogen oxidase
MKILIIGCGPTGLGAACKINDYLQKHPEKRIEVKIIDRESQPGGLSRTVYDSHGFGWDCGVHVTFSAFEFYNEILDKAIDTWKIHKRDVMIDLTSRFGENARYPYPIQKSIPYFPDEARNNCIEDVRALWKEKEEKEKAGQNGNIKVSTLYTSIKFIFSSSI